MGTVKQAIKKATSTIRGAVKGRPVPNTPKAGYTSDGSRYAKGGKLRKKKI